MLLHFLSSQIGITVVMFIIEKLIALISGNDNSAVINDYMTQSSIISALNMITFVLANCIFAMIGLRWSKTRAPSLFITRNFNIQYAVEYCVIGLGLWTISTYASSGIENIIKLFYKCRAYSSTFFVDRVQTRVSYILDAPDCTIC